AEKKGRDPATVCAERGDAEGDLRRVQKAIYRRRLAEVHRDRANGPFRAGARRDGEDSSGRIAEVAEADNTEADNTQTEEEVTMSASSAEGPGYSVQNSAAIAKAFLQLQHRATREGRGEELLSAAHQAFEHRRTTPTEFGE